MIGSLRGVVLDRAARGDYAGELLMEVGGVGYRLTVPAGTLSQVTELGAAAFLHVHTHVREDAIILYGFLTREERVCFEALIGAHGVGPAVALALLSVHSPVALSRAVATDDLDALMLAPGIGKKTAARLLIELKSRLDLDMDFGGAELSLVGAGSGATGSGGAGSIASPAAVRSAVRSEVRAALAGLGYGPDEVRHALSGLPGDGTVEDLLRLALRELAVAR